MSNDITTDIKIPNQNNLEAIEKLKKAYNDFLQEVEKLREEYYQEIDNLEKEITTK